MVECQETCNQVPLPLQEMEHLQVDKPHLHLGRLAILVLCQVVAAAVVVCRCQVCKVVCQVVCLAAVVVAAAVVAAETCRVVCHVA